ncbi:hypothetical protein NQ042_10555 [Corynebacterium phoceense]|uniref:hypothetical protein n=1 Tax=Corynebacterium phoceense TaxID=1686286 RepID=UPI00211BC64D|nr:hypothetical protein [Corynebacterium phoceense]MCQ9334505.1 hypothetical protein [Corynebacterium phoceense]
MRFHVFGRKNKSGRTLQRLSGTRLESARDRAGFPFGAIVRSAPRSTVTVCFQVDNPDEVTSEEVYRWEEAISRDETVLATAYGVDSTGCYMSVTFVRSTRAERKDVGEVLTRIAAGLPDLYEFGSIVATPLKASAVYDRLLGELHTSGKKWPELDIDRVGEEIGHVQFDELSAISFDVMDDAELDGVLRELVLDEPIGAVMRWTRLFRPGLEAEENDPGRHAGILTVAAEASADQVESAVAALMNGLSAMDRLRVRRIFCRQTSGFLAGLGIGEFVWDSDKITV